MSSVPIEELAVPFDPTSVLDKMARRKRMVRSRVISLVITAVVLVALYIWRLDQMSGAGFIVVYVVILGISLAWLGVYLVGYRQAKKELASLGSGIALRIGRPGVEMAGVFVPWADVLSLAAVKGRVWEPTVLELAWANGEPLTVAFDHMNARPATLDMTARAYSGGRHGIDLQALES